MVCSEFEPGVAESKAQTNPLSYGGNLHLKPTYLYICLYAYRSVSVSLFYTPLEKRAPMRHGRQMAPTTKERTAASPPAAVQQASTIGTPHPTVNPNKAADRHQQSAKASNP